MDGFTRRKEQNREKIVAAAADLLSRLGINKVSIGDIARQAGVSQVTIYNLFGGKDELVKACIKSTITKFTGEFRRIIAADKTYMEKLEDMFRFFMELSGSNRGLSDVNVHEYPQYRELIESSTEEIYNVLVDFVREGQKNGYLNSDISEDAVRAFIEIFVQGINASPQIHARTHRDPEFTHDLLRIVFIGFGRSNKEPGTLTHKR
ncbi:MAG: TetR/AcrR family transcriptional regulator [Dehalococcoidales bacterium]|jgi:AcrR family transcriptional regulator